MSIITRVPASSAAARMGSTFATQSSTERSRPSCVSLSETAMSIEGLSRIAPIAVRYASRASTACAAVSTFSPR